MKNLIDLLEVSKDDLPSIYCDMDMVLCDFLKGAEKVLGMPFVNANKQTRWEKISDTPDFWANLPWMPGAKRLYQRIAKYDPYILSAYPEKDVNARGGKVKWVLKNTRIPKSRILVVKRAEKQRYATHNGEFSVLIDDYIKNIKEWENKGGVGIHHTDVSRTLKELSNLGYK